VNNALRQRILERDGYICQYCGRTVGNSSDRKADAVIEHVNGRSEDECNLCVACRSCNSKKNRRTAEEWLADIDAQLSYMQALMDRRNRIVALLNSLNNGDLL